MNAIRPELPPLPALMRNLPVDERGYPVPWFVSWIDGKPEFRVADGAKFKLAVEKSLCWVCGNHVGPHFTFVIGPMCAVNRNTAEPPCHRACAEYSAKACPFLSKPHMRRREGDLPEASKEPTGMIHRNPGITCLWTTGAFEPYRGGNAVMFRLYGPIRVDWYAEGRPATRAEILESIESGLPLLDKMCRHDGDRSELERMFQETKQLLPA